MGLELGTSDGKIVAVRGSCVWRSPSDRRKAWAGSKGMHTNSSSHNLFPTKPFPPYHYQPPRRCIRVKYVHKRRTHTHTHTTTKTGLGIPPLWNGSVTTYGNVWSASGFNSAHPAVLGRQAWESDLMQGHHQPPPSEAHNHHHHANWWQTHLYRPQTHFFFPRFFLFFCLSSLIKMNRNSLASNPTSGTSAEKPSPSPRTSMQMQGLFLKPHSSGFFFPFSLSLFPSSLGLNSWQQYPWLWAAAHSAGGRRWGSSAPCAAACCPAGFAWEEVMAVDGTPPSPSSLPV